jgi:hypothetical protein
MTKNSASELATRMEGIHVKTKKNVSSFGRRISVICTTFLVLREDANFEDLYKQGREAYLDNNYSDCVKYIEAALRNSVF